MRGAGENQGRAVCSLQSVVLYPPLPLQSQAALVACPRRALAAVDLFANLPFWSVLVIMAGSDCLRFGNWIAYAGSNHLLRLLRVHRAVSNVSSAYAARLTARVGLNPNVPRLALLLALLIGMWHAIGILYTLYFVLLIGMWHAIGFYWYLTSYFTLYLRYVARYRLLLVVRTGM